MSQKIFVFKEYIQRHVLHTVKHLLKNPLENISGFLQIKYSIINVHILHYVSSKI